MVWGNTAKNLPFTCVSGGSQTTHAMTRAAYATAMDAKKKLQEIAAKKLGGKPEQYEVANERVFRKGGGAGMTLAQAAKHAIQLGGVYDGHEAPADVQQTDQSFDGGTGGPGFGSGGEGQLSRATAQRFPMWPALLKSKSMSKPASTTLWISWPRAMSGR